MKAQLLSPTINIIHRYLSILFLFTALIGCGGSSDATPPPTPVPTPSPRPPAPPCVSFDCLTAKFNLVTANLDGSNLAVIAKDTYREMTHPRITFDRRWIAYTRFNTLVAAGCAEEKGSNYTNTEIRVTNMDGSVVLGLTTADPTRASTNSYWIDNTYNFTFLDGVLGSTDATNKIKIKRGFRDANMGLAAATVAIPTPDEAAVFDPQQVSNKIVFGAQYNILDAEADVKSIFTMNLDGTGVEGRTVATVYKGTTPVVAAQAYENDPKFSPDGTKIAFMRKIDTATAANDHGFHIFVTSASGAPGSEVDISDRTIGQDVYFNDGVPEWIDNTTLVFFTLNFSTGVVQKLYTMKDDGTQRTEIPLPAGYYYSHVIPYQDAGKTKILFAANKSATSCSK